VKKANPGYRPTWQREDELAALGYNTIIGVDEAGRGPLAGPVVAGAVLLPRDFHSPHFELLHDSKQLDATARAVLYDEITQGALWGVGSCGAPEIDIVNIRQASWLAMQRAVADMLLRSTVEIDRTSLYVLIDGLPYGAGPWSYEAIVKGDARSVSIAAASIIAKQTRDSWMVAFDAQYPGYGFARHKGYPTAVHIKALQHLGPCVLHRRSFGPVRRTLEERVPKLEVHSA
jgi:ribonuclease HII